MCKIFGPKIWLCKIFDTIHVCEYWILKIIVIILSQHKTNLLLLNVWSMGFCDIGSRKCTVGTCTVFLIQWMFYHVLFELRGSITWVTALWANCFSPVWVLRCLFRALARPNDLPHALQWFGLSPLWVSRCSARFDFVIEEKSHHLHWLGFSPVWIRMWLFTVPAWLNELPHSLQWCGFSPLWVSTCWVRSDFVIEE